MADKPTWKEIDARRDRSSGRSRNEASPGTTRGSHMRVSKSDVDKLFSSSKLGEMIRKSEGEKNIESSSGTSLAAQVKKCLRIEEPSDFLKEARRILDEHEKVPTDMEFCERALEISHLPTVLRLLERIHESLKENRKPYMPRVLRIRCQTLPMKFQDPRIQEWCDKILDQL